MTKCAVEDDVLVFSKDIEFPDGNYMLCVEGLNMIGLYDPIQFNKKCLVLAWIVNDAKKKKSSESDEEREKRIISARKTATSIITGAIKATMKNNKMIIPPKVRNSITCSIVNRIDTVLCIFSREQD